MFIEIDDYSVVCSPADLDVLEQSDEYTRHRAENIAMSLIAGYVRARYDITAAYAKEGDERSLLLVQWVVSIALYYMSKWLPQFMASDKYELLYDDVLKILKDIQAGKFNADLPAYPADDTTGANQPLRYGSMPRQSYDW